MHERALVWILNEETAVSLSCRAVAKSVALAQVGGYGEGYPCGFLRFLPFRRISNKQSSSHVSITACWISSRPPLVGSNDGGGITRSPSWRV